MPYIKRIPIPGAQYLPEFITGPKAEQAQETQAGEQPAEAAGMEAKIADQLQNPEAISRLIDKPVVKPLYDFIETTVIDVLNSLPGTSGKAVRLLKRLIRPTMEQTVATLFQNLAAQVKESRGDDYKEENVLTEIVLFLLKNIQNPIKEAVAGLKRIPANASKEEIQQSADSQAAVIVDALLPILFPHGKQDIHVKADIPYPIVGVRRQDQHFEVEGEVGESNWKFEPLYNFLGKIPLFDKLVDKLGKIPILGTAAEALSDTPRFALKMIREVLIAMVSKSMVGIIESQQKLEGQPGCDIIESLILTSIIPQLKIIPEVLANQEARPKDAPEEVAGFKVIRGLLAKLGKSDRPEVHDLLKNIDDLVKPALMAFLGRYVGEHKKDDKPVLQFATGRLVAMMDHFPPERLKAYKAACEAYARNVKEAHLVSHDPQKVYLHKEDLAKILYKTFEPELKAILADIGLDAKGLSTFIGGGEEKLAEILYEQMCPLFHSFVKDSLIPFYELPPIPDTPRFRVLTPIIEKTLADVMKDLTIAPLGNKTLTEVVGKQNLPAIMPVVNRLVLHMLDGMLKKLCDNDEDVLKGALSSLIPSLANAIKKPEFLTAVGIWRAMPSDTEEEKAAKAQAKKELCSTYLKETLQTILMENNFTDPAYLILPEPLRPVITALVVEGVSDQIFDFVEPFVEPFVFSFTASYKDVKKDDPLWKLANDYTNLMMPSILLNIGEYAPIITDNVNTNFTFNELSIIEGDIQGDIADREVRKKVIEKLKDHVPNLREKIPLLKSLIESKTNISVYKLNTGLDNFLKITAFIEDETLEDEDKKIDKNNYKPILDQLKIILPDLITAFSVPLDDKVQLDLELNAFVQNNELLPELARGVLPNLIYKCIKNYQKVINPDDPESVTFTQLILHLGDRLMELNIDPNLLEQYMKISNEMERVNRTRGNLLKLYKELRAADPEDDVSKLQEKIVRMTKSYKDKLRAFEREYAAERPEILKKVAPLFLPLLGDLGFHSKEDLPIPAKFQEKLWTMLTNEVMPGMALETFFGAAIQKQNYQNHLKEFNDRFGDKAVKFTEAVPKLLDLGVDIASKMEGLDKMCEPYGIDPKPLLENLELSEGQVMPMVEDVVKKLSVVLVDKFTKRLKAMEASDEKAYYKLVSDIVKAMGTQLETANRRARVMDHAISDFTPETRPFTQERYEKDLKKYREIIDIVLKFAQMETMEDLEFIPLQFRPMAFEYLHNALIPGIVDKIVDQQFAPANVSRLLVNAMKSLNKGLKEQLNGLKGPAKEVSVEEPKAHVTLRQEQKPSSAEAKEMKKNLTRLIKELGKSLPDSKLHIITSILAKLHLLPVSAAENMIKELCASLSLADMIVDGCIAAAEKTPGEAPAAEGEEQPVAAPAAQRFERQEDTLQELEDQFQEETDKAWEQSKTIFVESMKKRWVTRILHYVLYPLEVLAFKIIEVLFINHTRQMMLNVTQAPFKNALLFDIGAAGTKIFQTPYPQTRRRQKNKPAKPKVAPSPKKAASARIVRH